MQLTNGDLYWTKKTKIQNTYDYLTHDETCDILIIGGGISGAITAYFLAKEGAKVIVVEKNIVGYGSTAATTALLEYQLDIDLYKLEKIIGSTNAKKIYFLCLDSIKKINDIDKNFDKNTEFKMMDTIYFSNKFMQKSNMNKEFITRKNAGFDTSFIENHSTLNLNSGILTKNSSATINPYLFTQELFNYLSKNENVKIYENTRVEDIKCSNDNVLCRTNNNFNISASKAIFTSGFECLKYLKNTPTELCKTFAIITEKNEKLRDMDTNFTAIDTVEPHHYIRFDSNNRIIFGGEDIKLTDKLSNSKYLSNVANDKYKKLYNSMKKIVNNVDNIKVDYAFNGTFANTKDSLPIIDEVPNMPNCFCNLGFGSNGILYSVIGGNILKDAVKGYYTKDINLFRIDR